MDLLELNKRGTEGNLGDDEDGLYEDEGLEGDMNDFAIRNSRQTGMELT